MPSRLRVGAIGVGGFAQGNIRRFLETPDVEITALVDPAPERLAATKKAHPALAGAAEYADHRRMLRGEKLDAVYISSPHTLHYPQILASLDAGLHVLVDKPMVCSIRHARDVVRKVRQAGLVLVVGYQRHYQGAFIYMRRQVHSGALGKLHFVSAFQSQDWFKGTLGLWRQSLKLSGGGQLNDSGSHLLDIIMWIVGEPVLEASAYCENLTSEVDINSAIKVKFQSGALGTIAVVGDGTRFWEEIFFVGDAGSLIYRNGELTHIAGADGPSMQLTFPQSSAHPVTNFVECIRNPKAVNETPAVCGLRTIELTEAAWKSAAAGGKVVKVPRTDA